MQDLKKGQWHNEPRSFTISDQELRVTTDPNTDFWRETHYGFVRDSGHFYGFAVNDSFTAQVRVQASFDHLYDQAGLMVRIDERRWVKAGLEFSDGVGLIGSVLTNESSDWATGRYMGDPSDFWLRVTVQHGVLRIQASSDGLTWPLVRLSPFPKAHQYQVGPMCCTPQRAGLEVAFNEWRLGQALGKDLHDLT
jgi:regulation of enolase protein 1 (concanavalin A-like superfamily)